MMRRGLQQAPGITTLVPIPAGTMSRSRDPEPGAVS